MPDLSPRNMAYIRQLDPKLHDAIQDIVAAVNNTSMQTSASPVGQTPAPSKPSSVQVDNGGSYLSIRLTDSGQQYRGKSHFAEIADNPSFTNAHKVEMGASNAIHYPVSPGTYHVRVNSAHPTTAPSDYVYHPPVAVSGAAKLPLQPASAVGTGGGGYGSQPYNTSAPPKR